MSQPNNFTVGAELEFYLFDKSERIIADINSGKFPQKQYDPLPEYEDAVQSFCDDLKIYKIKKESGPGQFEAEFGPRDNAEFLTTIINEFKIIAPRTAEKYGLSISFAAKPLDEHTGSALHIHFCSELFDPYGLVLNKGSMSPKVDPNNDYVKWAIGGLLLRMKQDLKIFLPTEESKKRLVDFMNAPTKICWGNNNRSVAIRIPDSKPKRIEHRVAGSDTNPGEVINAVIAAALHGIENQIDPGEPIFGNAWDSKYDREKILQ